MLCTTCAGWQIGWRVTASVHRHSQLTLPIPLTSRGVRRVRQMFGQALAVLLGIGFLTLQASSVTQRDTFWRC